MFGDGVVAARRRPDARARAASRRPAHRRQRPRARRRRPPGAGHAVEIWQANAAGRYRHAVDQWPAPLDPNFTGARPRAHRRRRAATAFTTIKPGAYPWRNHHNAWRPAHIHFSLFGRAFTQRLVTQMYFPDDPLFVQDPIFTSVPEAARAPAGQPVRPRPRPSPSGRWASCSTSCCAARRRRRSRTRRDERCR